MYIKKEGREVKMVLIPIIMKKVRSHATEMTLPQFYHETISFVTPCDVDLDVHR